MNKLKSYTEYIILIAAAALLLLYIIFRSAGNMNYKLPELESFDSADISKITIEGAADLEFTRKDSQWLIQPEGWTAENTNLNAIADALADPKLADLISTSGNPEIYSLDEANRVPVKAWDADGNLLREIYVGKVSGNGIYTYIMLPGDDNIYSVRGNLPSRVKDKDSMRDKRFISLNRDSVLKMTLHSPGAADITLFKDPEDVWRSTEFEPDNDAVKTAVAMLDPLRCKNFLYDQPPGKARWKIDFFTEDNKTTTLEIWPENVDKVYPARSSQNGYLAATTPYAAEKLLGAFGLSFDKE